MLQDIASQDLQLIDCCKSDVSAKNIWLSPGCSWTIWNLNINSIYVGRGRRWNKDLYFLQSHNEVQHSSRSDARKSNINFQRWHIILYKKHVTLDMNLN